jgi:hypothetical protein
MIATNKGVKMETAYRIMYDDLELFQRISYGFLEKDNVVRLFPTWRMAFEWLNLLYPELEYRDIAEMILKFEGISFNGFEVEGK